LLISKLTTKQRSWVFCKHFRIRFCQDENGQKKRLRKAINKKDETKKKRKTTKKKMMGV